ncbi:MAG: hypothetical protein P1U40_00925 [Coxiellaceae bacterium]|nr:hypothetical protein [Coxiellaceae bacterium]
MRNDTKHLVNNESVATAPPYSAAEPLYTSADLARITLTAMHVTELSRGSSGWVHFIFSSNSQAQSFVRGNHLLSEKPGVTDLKQVDGSRYNGLFTVRLSEKRYEEFRTEQKGLPEANSIRQSPKYG